MNSSKNSNNNTINYMPLLGWMREQKLSRKNLAEAATRAGVSIGPSSISKYISEGKAMPGEVIRALQKAYQWTDQETMHYCLGGAEPEPEPEPKPDPELVEKLVYESLGRLLEVIGTQIEIDRIKNKEESNENQ